MPLTARNTILRLLGAWLGLVLVGWAVGALVSSNLTAADLNAMHDFAAQRSAGLTSIAHLFSFLGSGYWVIPVTAAAFLLLYRIGRYGDAATIAVSVIGASALSTVDKLLVGRPRPPLEHLEAVGSASFPSGHSTSAGALYLALLLTLLRGRPPRAPAISACAVAVALMAGVALSRIYLGVHYPSDVISGLLLGCAWSLIVAARIRTDPSIDTVASSPGLASR